jgi:hypothetical protein
MDLPHGLSLDGMLRYMDSLPSLNADSYVTVDVRLGWRATKNLGICARRPEPVSTTPCGIPAHSDADETS